jgi:hypothetical protein
MGVGKTQLFEIVRDEGKQEREEPNRQFFTDPEEDEMLEEIKSKFIKSKPYDTSHFIKYIFNEFLRIVDRHFVESFVSRHSNDIEMRSCNPRESSRMNADHEDVKPKHSRSKHES